MTNQMKTDLIEASIAELRGLLEEHIDTIDQSMQSALAEHDKESAFVYPVALGLKITPYDQQAKVVAKISYSVKHSDETAGQIVDPHQMKMEI